MAKDKRPAAVVVKTARGLSPASAYDAECIDEDPINTEYDLVPRTKRSNKQNSLYWSILNNVAKATGKWASAEYLHHELKLICGYRLQIIDWETGEVSTVVDSTAFEKMNAKEFRAYFDLAMTKLAEHLGFDPMQTQFRFDDARITG